MGKKKQGGWSNKQGGGSKKQVVKKNKVRGSKKAVENNTKNNVRVLKIQVVKINKVGCQKNRWMLKKKKNKVVGQKNKVRVPNKSGSEQCKKQG